MEITPRGGEGPALAAFGVQVGPNAGEELPIRLPVVTVGRGRQNDLVLADDSVSTNHARLEYADGAWRITDLASANGTFVESVRLAPEVPTPLPYGSSVRFGGARLHFRAIEGADPDAARASYTPPSREPRVREARGGFRIPVYLLVLLLVLLALAALLVFGGTPPAPPPQPVTPAAPVGAPAAPQAPGAPGAPEQEAPGSPPTPGVAPAPESPPEEPPAAPAAPGGTGVKVPQFADPHLA